MIGDTVWIFDENHRVYRKDENGRSFGGPIYREHWVPTKITGETTRSWLIGYGEKIPKKGWNPRAVAFSLQEVEEQAYVMDNRHRLGDRVRDLRDAPTMRAIAAILDGVK